jgi:hypothetical protein
MPQQLQPQLLPEQEELLKLVVSKYHLGIRSEFLFSRSNSGSGLAYNGMPGERVAADESDLEQLRNAGLITLRRVGRHEYRGKPTPAGLATVAVLNNEGGIQVGAPDYRPVAPKRANPECPDVTVGADGQVRLPSPGPMRQKATPESIFCKRGSVWTLSFEGRTIQIESSLGMDYIAELLRNPHKPIPAVLLAGVNVETSSCAQPTGIPLTDRRALKCVRVEIDATESELRQLATNDWTRRGELEEKLTKLTNYIREGEGLRGRIRKVADGAERARKSVSQAIYRAFDRVSDQHPDLGLYLREYIHPGIVAVYSPSVVLDWQFQSAPEPPPYPV